MKYKTMKLNLLKKKKTKIKQQNLNKTPAFMQKQAEMSNVQKNKGWEQIGIWC